MYKQKTSMWHQNAEKNMEGFKALEEAVNFCYFSLSQFDRYAIAMSLQKKQRVIYTTPIKVSFLNIFISTLILYRDKQFKKL